jgi:hypothetical protein
MARLRRALIVIATLSPGIAAVVDFGRRWYP